MSDDPPELPVSPDEPPQAPVEVAADPAPLAADPAPLATDVAAPAASPPAPAPAPASNARNLVRRFAFLAIPAIALLELGAHLVQVNTVVTDAQWLAARDAVRTLAHPEDLVVMAPYWTDPLGRELFKDEILTIAREARPDATRFPRAVEVSIRGEHDDELKDWKVSSTKKVGPVTLTVRENPSYTPIKDDLVDHVAPGKMAVTANGTECAFQHTRVETGPLGFGPALPADRFTCPGGGLIAATIMQPADYRPHRCLFAPPMGGGKTLRVRFLDVAFGETLHGHAGLDWDSTAHAEEPPVTVVWKVGERVLARISAGNKDGWKPFALDTRDLAGTKGELVAEVSSGSSRNRLYCFEADTR